MDQLHIANKVCGGCFPISLNTVDTESSVSPNTTYCINFRASYGHLSALFWFIFFPKGVYSHIRIMLLFTYDPTSFEPMGISVFSFR